jgi:hypothetical protein
MMSGVCQLAHACAPVRSTHQSSHRHEPAGSKLIQLGQLAASAVLGSMVCSTLAITGPVLAAAL